MADWTSDSLMGCEGIIQSPYLYGDRFCNSSDLHYVPSVLGTLLCLSSDIGNPERLLTEQCSHPHLGVPVLVQALFPCSGSGALNDGV